MKFFPRLLKRAAAGAIILAAAATVFAWLILRASLPRLSGEQAAPGLREAVSIARDAAGIPVLTAQNRHDLAYATGYVHGQDRYFQMDLSRRQAAGELAALVGPAALPLDRYHRLHRFRTRAKNALQSLDPRESEVLEAYADGANAALDSQAGRPFEYVVLRSTPEPWRAEDSLLVLYAMFFELNDERADRDVRRGLAARILPSDVFDFLYPAGTRWDAPLAGEPLAGPPVPGPDIYDLRRTTALRGAVAGPEQNLMPGSNNWAVAGANTRSGRAIVANDMHLGLTVPNVFYRARFVVDGADAIDVSGVTLPGTPVIVTGSNGHVAWAFTNSYGDWSDAVLLTPGHAPGTYRTPEGERSFVEYRERIEVKGAPAEELVVRETVWGPVRDDIDYPDGEIAIRWIAHDTQAVNMVQLELESVRTVQEAVGVANRIGIPPQNFVCGDAAGSIAWTIAGQIPERGEFDPLLPADWSSAGGWPGWYPPDSYPRLVNPVEGRLWTANARVTEGADLEKIGDGGYALGARARQIRDLLRARDHFAPADMLPIQLDDRALFLQRWRDLLLSVLDAAAIDGEVGRAEYRRLVEDWIPRAAPDSTGYRLVRAFHAEVEKTVFEMLMTPVREGYEEPVTLRISRQFEGPLWSLVNERPAHLLTADYPDWRELLLAAVDRNLAAFAEIGDGPLSERTWGERNTAAIRHPLSPALPMFARWLDMPRDPLPGDSKLPRAQGPSFGASERFAVSPGDEGGGYMHMPAGQSGHPLSPYYRRGHADWVEGLHTPFLPGPAVHTLVLRPAQTPDAPE
ncbi:MAG: penicillin acylase family protein [Woeseia sp.]